MGKGRPRAVETGVVGHCLSSSGSGSLNLPQAPVFYPTEEEFKDPLRFIAKIRSEAEPFGICRIVPPKCWKPPFALDLQSFTFPTKCQAIHHLQARPAACDPETFELEYDRFLKNRGGKRSKKRPIFQAEELDLCKLFNTVKRYGGYEKVVKEKKWGDVFQIVCSVGKISTCSKHVLCQLYRDHLFDYEEYHNCLNGGKRAKKCKRTMCRPRRNEGKSVGSISGSKRKRGAENSSGERRKEHDLDEEGDRDQICEQCKSGLHGEVMLLCDRCDRGWHLHCLSPPLECVPSGNWYCLECINSNKDSFGFVPGKHFSLEAFRRLADRAKRKWFGSAQVTRSQIEKRFWEIVEGSTGEVEVMYGSDLDTSLFGSGFPRTHDPIPSSAEVEIWKEYCSSPWNLNNLPKLQGSMLQAVHDNIAGVIVPWLYVGMLFSSFCWHVEDHCFYSMNYLHWGEPKCWYSVPGGEARAFEQVMRNTLPDLFEAQPDLLFQLVTMLNPSVLQENGVPVYSVLQEPGNFVITFPRAFHGGFNFGLNCAEAVNFAPADWLPHGGFGAEQYRLYHKAAVLSHEELLCVVAKSGCSNEALPYLMEEMLRIISKERTYREKLWRSGIVKSSRMPPRNHPEYVGTEEDPTCIICQQYLYLSAVICSCRPSAFVCLEHWEHLCECNPNQLRLLYRHNLAELDDLVPLGGHTLTMGQSLEKTIRTHSRACRRQVSFSNKSNTLTKKVNGSFATHTQLAEDWLVSSLNIFEIPFSEDASISALNEAEQFLWAGREMDPVRNMAKNLVEAQKWAADVRDCLSKVEAWLHLRNSALEKVSLAHVQNLLSFDIAPCVEPGHPKLKVYAEEAQKLDAEIRSSLSSHSCVGISELEVLYSRALELPIDLEESQRLASNISCAKVWVESVNKYLGDGRQLATPIDIDDLYKLNSQMLELHVQLPEMELLTDLLRQVESWQFRSSEMLRGPINLKELELILRDADNFIVMTPEMKVLKQYHSDALSWKCRCHDVLENICEREDHGNVVEDLTCLLKAGNSLRVQVEELLLVETELRKSICRERASKAYSVRMPLEFIQQIRAEAVLLKLENEKIFIDIFGTLGAAISWEERAKHVLESSGPMSEFEDVIRKSEEIFTILPSLDNVNNVVSNAKSWIERSEPFLLFAGCAQRACSTLLKVDALKELISQSKLLKVSLKEPEILQLFLNNVEGWQHDACPLLEHTSILFNMDNKDSAMNDGLKIRIEELLARIKFVTDAGISLGFDLREIPELKNASSALDWSLKALSFCFSTPSLKEVESLIEDAVKIPNTFVNSALVGALIEGAIWLKKALVLVLEHHHPRRCKLKDVEEVLDEAQRVKLLYPMKVSQLVIAVEKHKYWQEQVHLFFESQSGGQSWSSLLQLKELGDSHAFDCPELDKIAFEVEKIDRWMLRCKYIVGLSIGGPIPLVTALVKIKDSLDRALCIYSSSSFEDKELIVCLKCKGRYRLSCMVTSWATADLGRGYKCPFCRFLEIEDSNEELPLISRRNRPKLQTLIELLSDARGFYSGIKEQDLLQEIVERALACKSYLTETVNCALSYRDEDLCFISESILIALKAAEVVGVYDYQNSFKLKLALTRQAWKIRVKKLLEATEKPLLQQIQCILKEGLAIHISSEDYFVMKLREVKHICQQWASNAKKVATDSGALELNSVFQLITEGENLPVHFEKELELLKARSVLYCICRKPYDQRPMIACDQCNEWYHFECINIREPPPKDFLCPACDPPQAEYLSLSVSMHRDERMSVDWASQTPPQETESKRRQRTSKSKF